ncbi:T9SS type A sorting domain-containing protein [Chryseobacterium koreense]|uniref:T9SS type A sorting domain-containing protein n=1 Tax=Chryseobacterium koreense TaxID=232216 RepID=UPI0026F26BED|nr:T9SS type A sorting domain-containing protein [Chryseobacterium koreense]
MKSTLSLIFMLFATVFFAQETLFSPYEGWMANPGTVTIAQPNSIIYYTMDGTEPNLSSPSAGNSVNISISTKTTFKAFYVQNGTASPVETITYYVGAYFRPKLFFKPPTTWSSSCAHMQIIEPRTIVDFFEPGPVMNDACEGWKQYPANFAVGSITFNNCLMYPPNVQYAPNFIVSDHFFYDFSNGVISDPPACLMSTIETQGKAAVIKIFPNPVTEILNFESALTFNSYEILDASGKILTQNMLSQKQINVSKLSKGVYFLKLFSDQKKNEHFIRFIKK